jgi:dihydrofolate synthase/folylpolyglutamate synthase
MNYTAAVDFLLARTDYERWPGYTYASRFDLRRMDILLKRLGDPHRGLRSVHVAGSKGKGSTSAMIAAGLQAAGYRTGLYTSPHLVTLRERISVDGRPILKRELAEVMKKLKPAADETDREATYGELTTFELLTAAAFLHFHDKGVDCQVLETGLGGRLDATNVVTPELCVITSISLDHTEVLGDTIAQIAGEKAGIIKPGVPVVVSPQTAEALEVISRACLQTGSRLVSVGQEVSWQCTGHSLSGQSLAVKGIRELYNLTIPLLGSHQMENAATAVAALEMLGVPKGSIVAGLAATRWRGRLQVLRRRPMLVVDGAHSGDSAAKLRQALADYFHFDTLVLIIGTSADKDLAGIAAELAPLDARVIATRSRHPRATDPERVASEFSRRGAVAEVSSGVGEAVAEALRGASNTDLICATGSLFLVGEVIECVKGLRPEAYPQ